MPATLVVGGFFGDEGKGKIVSHITSSLQPTIIARGGVGPNAGHTVVIGDITYKLRLIPSGFHFESARLLIGPGVLVNPAVLRKELEVTKVDHRLGIDYQCGIIEPQHIERDTKDKHLREKVGTSGSGCGPANEDRAKRILKLAKEIPELSDFLTDVPGELHEALDKGETVLVEGSQATYLSLFHGTYPFVTSKDTTAGQLLADVGIGPKHVDDVIIVFKAYVTRVGEGPLKNELSPEEIQKRGWEEHGTVTGRLRRAAPFDFDLAKRSVKLNSATKIAVTKLDKVFPETKGVTRKEDLSQRAVEFLEQIEEETGIPVWLVGTGPKSSETLHFREE